MKDCDQLTEEQLVLEGIALQARGEQIEAARRSKAEAASDLERSKRRETDVEKNVKEALDATAKSNTKVMEQCAGSMRSGRRPAITKGRRKRRELRRT